MGWQLKQQETHCSYKLTLQDRFLFSSQTFFPLHSRLLWLHCKYNQFIAQISQTSLPHTAYTVEIDDSDRAWEADAARTVSSTVTDVTSTVPCTGSAAKVQLFTADSAGTQPGNHGDGHRGMPLSVINWHGWVLVVAGHCHMLLPSFTQLYLAQVSREGQRDRGTVGGGGKRRWKSKKQRQRQRDKEEG